MVPDAPLKSVLCDRYSRQGDRLDCWQSAGHKLLREKIRLTRAPPFCTLIVTSDADSLFMVDSGLIIHEPTTEVDAVLRIIAD